LTGATDLLLGSGVEKRNKEVAIVDVSDLRCVHCNGATLAMTPIAGSDRLIKHGAIICKSCFSSSDVINDVPFIGGYDGQDFIGLIEVVATAEMNIGGISIETARLLQQLLKEYHEAPDKAHWIQNHPNEMVRASWFSYRYHDFIQSHSILINENLFGKKS
jgi:hypothetical protein